MVSKNNSVVEFASSARGFDLLTVDALQGRGDPVIVPQQKLRS
jgi:hypothetical protein